MCFERELQILFNDVNYFNFAKFLNFKMKTVGISVYHLCYLCKCNSQLNVRDKKQAEQC